VEEVVIAEPPVPRLVGESVVAPGRVLAWAEFGHPDGDPLLWFHGTPGACMQVPPAVHEVALQRGFRVIGVERPGTGRSTDHYYDRILDIAPDIEALADDLGLDRFGVVGLSGGGPYTLACGYAMPQRVVVACTLGGMAPLRGPDAVWSYMRLLRFGAPMLELVRGPAGTAISAMVRCVRPVGDQAIDLFGRLVGGSDQAILRDPYFKAMFVSDLAEAGEVRSIVHDLALFSRHWGFLLEDVRVPVVVWQGLADSIVPQSHGHHLAARLPNAQLRVRHGEGHFAGFSDIVAILDSIREVWAFETAEPVSGA
jgi:pimeloyl-ACP methyl ester carboxylesterase